MKHTIFFYLLITFICLQSCINPTSGIKIKNYQKLYDEFQVEGSFFLYDVNKDRTVIHNEPQVDHAFIPASTFKICNSLIGLETGVIPDMDFTLPWDSIQRSVPSWNKDTNFKEAFKNSAVWYYQELATRVGQDRMDEWINKLSYGNKDASGGITTFWLTGDLRITPRQQLNFIYHLIHNELPVSQRSADMVKEMMILEEADDFILRGKTGWGIQEDTNIGWLVGYLEKNDNNYIFVNCIQSKGENPNFGEARIAIAKKALKDLGLLK